MNSTRALPSRVISQYSRLMILPLLFASCVWWIFFYPTPVFPQLPITFMWKASSNNYSTHDKHHLIPHTMHAAFQLGEISSIMKSFPKRGDAALLLEQANQILDNKDCVLTKSDLIDGNIERAINEYCNQRSKYQLLKRAFSFVGILSIISIAGILFTLGPTLVFVYEVLHLEIVWRWLNNTTVWVVKVIDPLMELILFSIPLILIDQSLYLQANGARSQMDVLAGGLAVIAFCYRVWRSRHWIDITDDKYFVTVSFLWAFEYLIPLALIGSSQFLGFFAVGSIFGTLGFVAFPTPYGWAAGFQDKFSMNNCISTSLSIIFLSILTKFTSFPPLRIMEYFQLGMSVFGMLAFGLAGLIKSSQASNDDNDRYGMFGGATKATSFVYPVVWLMIGFVGSLTSSPSLTNTSITFVSLWISQFYCRIVGFTSVGTFFFSWALFYVTLQLKSHENFVRSIFKFERNHEAQIMIISINSKSPPRFFRRS